MSLLVTMLNATYHISASAYSILASNIYCDSYCVSKGYAFGHPLNCLEAIDVELPASLASYYNNSNGKCLCLNSMEKQALDKCGNAGPCSTYGISSAAAGFRFHVLTTGNSFNCNSGYGDCICKPGYYADNQTCVQCDTGHSCWGGNLYPKGLSGTRGSTICSIGFYQSYMGQSKCNPCPVGYYGETTGLNTCSPCTSGHYAASTGTAYSCEACGHGFYQSMTGQGTCTKCPSLQSIAGRSYPGADNITKCFLPGNDTYLYSDAFGKYKFPTDCYYIS